ncbi:hypothetical protein [Pusillimonas sp. ANT_WB101]|uniref:hypothetical protein n=1 Tax=Pusillimonas sp. ANT_WB101 TaxID=2597356 RepID=UPI0011EC10CA|nr:hypothetical protein [Pusillimonas sp. ANT_WB101]KAA0890797.1 hypothetical protein FQ179_14145 [Pusillimonas sp. ANT_WB101]
MQVTTTNVTPQASKTAQSPQEKRFDQAWHRVTNQQKENDGFREDAQAFAQATRARIRDKEKAYMDVMYGLCLHLLSFFSRKSLARWQRETLLEWVGQYLQIMQNNPFGSHLNMEPIHQGLEDALAVTYPDSEYAADPSDEEDLLSEELFEELFAKFEQAGKTSGSGQNADEADADGAYFEHERAHDQQRYDESLALKRLMKSSSMNKLFRKVAGILHPDKEPDETERQNKNRLMGELIQARNTNDIPRIFSFYIEYVGQSPLQELGEDLDGATQLLERQYRHLCDEKERILHEDPITGALYRRFHKETPAATQRAITRHLKETQTQTTALQALLEETTSLKKLKPYLELHYEMLL